MRFAYRLALELRIPNPAVMLRAMPIRVFLEWAAFYQVEPWGSRVGFIQNATLCSTVAQMLGDKNATAADFMPDFTAAADDEDQDRPQGPTLGGPRKTDAQMTSIILIAAGRAKEAAKLGAVGNG